MYQVRALNASGTSCDACQTIRNYSGIFERMRLPTVRRIVSNQLLILMEDILSIHYKCVLSAITHKLNVPDTCLYGHCVLFWHMELVPKLSALFSYTL
jgi:hypothetical protein